MADTITICCPECQRQTVASADVAGKKIRCKGCDTVFKAEPVDAVDEVDEVDEVEEAPKAPAGKPAAPVRDAADPQG